ncbi:MAG: FAD-binding oxidoreductase [Alphaproteobacteria bacterium]|nr:FAD-binding oxidoreductase [Alphaproteobacteria bacterium]MBU1516692.1 FAD-binding oxidoreductase [Alphaproteobacteria bacterium]MBU2094448.1 FAD-binding oxidoreductase [Alphaproteobacteria bacterium]MBU2152675.1 FAD-binding oxidoreductase [Alphaproteobacteria bacterium]MBU2306167.1 FAD-binding oxidoreductase [Alphaproteobacteria bacterium]
MSLTEHLDLRGGRVCWPEADDSLPAADPLPRHAVDVAIVGAGVMGAMLAERLTAAGRTVALLDRRPPARGSTAASTALVMWAADTPLTALTETWGPAEAQRRWRRVHAAVLELAARVATLGLDCRWASRPELYLAGDLLDAHGLRREAAARQAAGLPSAFLEADLVASRFGLPSRAALVSGDAFEVDPVALTQGLLAAAAKRGATLTWPADVTDIVTTAAGVRLTTAKGATLDAGQAIIATGYEAARQYLPAAFRLGSSFAIATAPGTDPAWRDEALIWEAADPYLYARGTADGRIIVGGADEDFADPARRDAMLDAKRAVLERRGAEMLGIGELRADCAWAATFGSSPDGLPAIGRVQGQENLWLAAGFGGNGVTFASLGASLIAAALAGAPDPDEACFSPYRFG